MRSRGGDTVGSTPEGKPQLFVLRVWTDTSETEVRLSRGVIEHVRSGERQYFRELSEVQAFVSRHLSFQERALEGGEDAQP